jgi:hypothetical protein
MDRLIDIDVDQFSLRFALLEQRANPADDFRRASHTSNYSRDGLASFVDIRLAVECHSQLPTDIPTAIIFDR